MKLLCEILDFKNIEVLKENFERDGEKVKQYFLKGPFLEADTLNKNGRKYMKETLLREIKKFCENKIKTNRSLGELDHPPCYLQSYQALTKNGWKKYEQLQVGEDILTLNPETNIIESQPIEKLIKVPYNGHAYHVHGKNINSKVTPTHRFLLEDRYGKKEFVTIENIYNNRKKYNKYEFAGHRIKPENKAPLYQLNLSTTPSIYLDEKFLNIDKIEHDGDVYCLTVENSNFYINDNNKSYLTGNSPTINLDRVSHIITDLKMQDNIGYGVARLMDTPMGRIAKTLVDEGVIFGMSTRGVGSLDGEFVKDDYNLITIDIVADPSAPSAYVEGVLENKEFIIGKDGEIVEKAVENLQKKVNEKFNKYSRKDMSTHVLQYLNEFIEEVKIKQI